MPARAAKLLPNVRADFRYMLTREGHSWSRSPRTLALCLGYLLARPGATAVWVYRCERALYRWHLVPLAYVAARLNQVMHGIEIPPTVKVGPGFVVYHPSGIVLHGDVRVGQRFRIHTGAVLGIRGTSDGRTVGPPVVGDDVLVGTGAKLLGDIKVGDGAQIGANAVLVQDAPPGSTATGIPATLRLAEPAVPARDA
ncbi:MAG: serine O-acetyltransferase [Mycobacteriales bacterium]